MLILLLEVYYIIKNKHTVYHIINKINDVNRIS